MLKRSLLSTFLLSQLLASSLPVLGSGGPTNSLYSEEAAGDSVLSGTSSSSTVEPLDWDAINPLWYSRDDRRDQNRESLRSLLLAVAQTPGHPDQRFSFLRTWNLKGEHRQEDRARLRPMFLEIAQNPTHRLHWDALSSLWDSELPQQEEDRALLYPILLGDAQNPQFSRQLPALLKLSAFVGRVRH